MRKFSAGLKPKTIDDEETNNTEIENLAGVTASYACWWCVYMSGVERLQNELTH